MINLSSIQKQILIFQIQSINILYNLRNRLLTKLVATLPQVVKKIVIIIDISFIIINLMYYLLFFVNHIFIFLIENLKTLTFLFKSTPLIHYNVFSTKELKQKGTLLSHLCKPPFITFPKKNHLFKICFQNLAVVLILNFI